VHILYFLPFKIIPLRIPTCYNFEEEKMSKYEKVKIFLLVVLVGLGLLLLLGAAPNMGKGRYQLEVGLNTLFVLDTATGNFYECRKDGKQYFNFIEKSFPNYDIEEID
jgi:hypothetical protein